MVNFISVVLGAVAYMVVGMIWYGPLFGKAWMKLVGLTKKDLAKAKKKGMGKTYAGNFAATLLTVYVLALFLELFANKSVQTGMLLGFWIWLGFLATSQLNTVFWEGKPFRLYMINASMMLIGLVAAGAVIGAI